jgi:hypothetical protein
MQKTLQPAGLQFEVQYRACAVVGAATGDTAPAKIAIVKTNLIIVFGPSVAGIIALGWIAALAAPQEEKTRQGLQSIAYVNAIRRARHLEPVAHALLLANGAGHRHRGDADEYQCNDQLAHFTSPRFLWFAINPHRPTHRRRR